MPKVTPSLWVFRMSRPWLLHLTQAVLSFPSLLSALSTTTCGNNKMYWYAAAVKVCRTTRTSVSIIPFSSATNYTCNHTVHKRPRMHILWPEQSLGNASPLSCSHCTDSLLPNGFSTKSSVSHIIVFMKHDRTSYLQELMSQYNPPTFSPLLFPLQTEHLWIWQEHRHKNVQGQGHSAMLHPPSGTGCQTSFTKQKTLLLFGGIWNHICFQL